MSRSEFAVHGHFYQPPRENPWTEEVDREKSAGPAHDWNERIAAESYRPNAVARIADDQGRVVAIVDNYEHISYNVGPTLLSWLERHQPATYQAMIDGDKLGGGAIAQAFGHIILPLATESDIRTQVRWGLADFRHRFGRDAKGMWLPECAVNDTVLRILAEEGVRFTVLAPGQAAAIRSLEGTHNWVDVNSSWFDTSRPYRWMHPDGERSIEIVFYNGALSHAVAFEMSNIDSQGLIDRVMAAAGGRPGLVTLATDGETFGHHHRYGDRMLAYALAFEAPRRNFPHTNLNRGVEALAPTHEVRVHESAWSCAHGVGRWREDCGCSTGGGPGWDQKWRAPLRSALDQLRAVADEVVRRRGPAVLKEPNDALDDYVNVLIGATTKEKFAKRWVTGDAVEAFTLLEMQRHAMAMFTSCGWFFNDLAGIETVQVLRYAARVLDLMDELDEPSALQAFLAVLGEARSNMADEGTGLDVWKRQVVTARVDSARVVAHLALGDVLEKSRRPALGPYGVKITQHKRVQRGLLVLSSGFADVLHARTGRREQFVYAVLGLGGLELSGALQHANATEAATALEPLRSAFAKGEGVPGLLRALEKVGDFVFDLSSALPDEAERMMQDTVGDLSDRYTDAFERLYQTHRATIEDLARHGYQLPSPLRAPAELSLARRFREAVIGAEASTDPAAYDDAIAIAQQARAAGFEVDMPATTQLVERLVLDVVENAVHDPTEGSVQAALDVLRLADELHAPINRDLAQETVFYALRDHVASAVLIELWRPLARVLNIKVD